MLLCLLWKQNFQSYNPTIFRWLRRLVYAPVECPHGDGEDDEDPQCHDDHHDDDRDVCRTEHLGGVGRVVLVAPHLVVGDVAVGPSAVGQGVAHQLAPDAALGVRALYVPVKWQINTCNKCLGFLLLLQFVNRTSCLCSGMPS